MKDLKKIIQKVNPEIMELKFGCEIILDGTKNVIGGGLEFNGEEYYFSGCGCCAGYLKPKTLKILGRPIRLADVFLSVEEKFARYSIITKKPHYETFGEIAEKWNLKDDNLDNQLPETISFLKKLLT